MGKSVIIHVEYGLVDNEPVMPSAVRMLLLLSNREGHYMGHCDGRYELSTEPMEGASELVRDIASTRDISYYSYTIGEETNIAGCCHLYLRSFFGEIPERIWIRAL